MAGKAWREVAYVSLVIGNIVAASCAGALTLAVGIYGPSYLASVWFAPVLLVLGPVIARVGSDQITLERSRRGWILMTVPIIAGAGLAAWYWLTVSAGQRAYDALNSA